MGTRRRRIWWNRRRARVGDDARMSELKEKGEREEAGRWDRRRREKGRERREVARRRREATKGLPARPETRQWDRAGRRVRREREGWRSGRRRRWRRKRALAAAHAGSAGREAGDGGAMQTAIAWSTWNTGKSLEGVYVATYPSIREYCRSSMRILLMRIYRHVISQKRD